MIYGMYLSTMGAMVQNSRHGVIANNMANASTTGYKPDRTTFQALPAESLLQPGSRAEVDKILERTGGGTWINRMHTIFNPGPMRATGAPLDLAVDDSVADPGSTGFFMVRPGGEDGEVRYTRNGHFSLDGQGRLVTSDGGWVLDPQGGPIVIPADAPGVRIDEAGTVRRVDDNAELGQVGVVRTREAHKMRKVGDNLFARDDAELAADPRGVRSGMLEESAANPITEMVSMIEGYRTYEANMRFISIQDETLGDTVRRVGAIA